MELVKINVGKGKKKRWRMRTRHLEYGDVRFYQQHIDTLGHVSETPSDWLAQNDHANAPEVSVSQKPTRGEI